MLKEYFSKRGENGRSYAERDQGRNNEKYPSDHIQEDSKFKDFLQKAPQRFLPIPAIITNKNSFNYIPPIQLFQKKPRKLLDSDYHQNNFIL